ncbi:glycosyltransferase family 2 protein [Paenibacillus sp. GCM10027628]|uniref:glycosyltransferase family 2 protein n=1 Tax=Paenibacillus sp. GCM10027628 TaxID=3273413 RepID=UPI0036309F9C
MKFSLVMPTKNRTAEVEEFLHSLEQQTYRKFELIVVDQNEDNRLEPIIKRYEQKFNIVHLRSETGLSLARNKGLSIMTGDIVAFPDDDCKYPPILLEQILELSRKNSEYAGFTGQTLNDDFLPSHGKFDSSPGQLNKLNVWKRAISITIFLKREVIEKVGAFDETLGVGANTPWGSGEETDFLIRALNSGYKLFYDPQIIVLHPIAITEYNKAAFQRSYKYNSGMGRVLRKHNYPIWYVMYLFARPIAGMALAILKGNVKKLPYNWNMLRGRIKGWVSI